MITHIRAKKTAKIPFNPLKWISFAGIFLCADPCHLGIARSGCVDRKRATPSVWRPHTGSVSSIDETGWRREFFRQDHPNVHAFPFTSTFAMRWLNGIVAKCCFWLRLIRICCFHPSLWPITIISMASYSHQSTANRLMLIGTRRGICNVVGLRTRPIVPTSFYGEITKSRPFDVQIVYGFILRTSPSQGKDGWAPFRVVDKAAARLAILMA